MGSGNFRDDNVGRDEEKRIWFHADGMVKVVREYLVYGGGCVRDDRHSPRVGEVC